MFVRGGTHAMLKRIVLLTSPNLAVAHDDTISKTAAVTIKNCSFTFEEQTLAEKLVEVLDPFLKATESVASEKIPTMHKVMPILLKLESVTAVTEDDPLPLAEVKRKMRLEIEKRTKDTELALIACILNPFTKDLRFLTQENRHKALDLLHMMTLEISDAPVKIKQEKQESCPSVNTSPLPQLSEDESASVLPQPLEYPSFETQLPDNTPSQPSFPEIEILENPVPSKKVKASAADMDDRLLDVICTGESKMCSAELIQQEIASYLSTVLSPTDKRLTILEWWEQNERFYPRLSVLAKKYLAVPASSIPSERIFSLCGLLVSKKRSRLNPRNVSTMVFLNKNMDLYW